MTKAQILAKEKAFRELVLAQYPRLRAFNPSCSSRPFIPPHRSARSKAAYVLFTLDRMLSDERRMTEATWLQRAYRQLRFVEGLLWGADLASLSVLVEIDERVCPDTYAGCNMPSKDPQGSGSVYCNKRSVFSERAELRAGGHTIFRYCQEHLYAHDKRDEVSL